MRALVTGAAGFVGSHLSDRLIADGYTVVGIDNFETGHTRNLQDAARVVRGDIAGWEAIDRAFNLADPDVVFHCAASYKDPTAWNRDISTNAIGTANVVRLAEQYGARIIYFQTALCYGHNPEPFYTDDTMFTAEQPIAPDNSYSISKTAGESLIIHSGVPYVSLRLANIYGPRNLSGPIPTFAKNILEGRTSVVVDSRRDLVYIDDLLNLVWRVLDSDYVGVLHASTGRDYAIEEMWAVVALLMDADSAAARRIPRAPGDAPSILLDPSETEERFGWKAQTPLALGIGKAVEWYRANPPEETFTHLKVPVAA